MRFLVFLPLLHLVWAPVSFERAGWLDNVIEYQKNNFLDDLKKMGTFKVEVRTAPPGYKDSDLWDYESVQRLLSLIFMTDSAKPLQQMLVNALRPNRRYGLSPEQSLIKIPSLAASHPGFFYDYGTSDISPPKTVEPHPWRELKDDEILYISNPIEAHIPSAHISVAHIREILNQRSLRARIMASKSPEDMLEIPNQRSLRARIMASKSPQDMLSSVTYEIVTEVTNTNEPGQPTPTTQDPTL